MHAEHVVCFVPLTFNCSEWTLSIEHLNVWIWNVFIILQFFFFFILFFSLDIWLYLAKLWTKWNAKFVEMNIRSCRFRIHRNWILRIEFEIFRCLALNQKSRYEITKSDRFESVNLNWIDRHNKSTKDGKMHRYEHQKSETFHINFSFATVKNSPHSWMEKKNGWKEEKKKRIVSSLRCAYESCECLHSVIAIGKSQPLVTLKNAIQCVKWFLQKKYHPLEMKRSNQSPLLQYHCVCVIHIIGYLHERSSIELECALLFLNRRMQQQATEKGEEKKIVHEIWTRRHGRVKIESSETERKREMDREEKGTNNEIKEKKLKSAT